MTKAQKIKLVRSVIRRAFGRVKVEVAMREYEDGTTSFDTTLEGHGEHDLGERYPLRSLRAAEWPRDGALDLFVYECRSPGSSWGGSIITNIDVHLSEGRIIRIADGLATLWEGKV
jgi:hypothetical protein